MSANYMKLVREFHVMIGLPGLNAPGPVPLEVREARIRMIREEVDELAGAEATGDLVGIADGLADTLYTLFGTAVMHGLDMDRIFREVHRSNMSKRDGHLEDGKWIKPANWSPPELEYFVFERPAPPECSCDSGFTAGCHLHGVEAKMKPWMIWSNVHDAWWRPRSAGYTVHKREAGLYPHKEATEIVGGCRAGDQVMVRAEDYGE